MRRRQAPAPWTTIVKARHLGREGGVLRSMRAGSICRRATLRAGSGSTGTPARTMAIDPLGMFARVAQCGGTAHREAHEPHVVEAQGVEEGGQVVDERSPLPATRDIPARRTMGARVRHEEPEVLPQQRPLCAPVTGPHGGGAVEQHERGAVTLLLVVDEQAVRGDLRHARRQRGAGWASPPHGRTADG